MVFKINTHLLFAVALSMIAVFLPGCITTAVMDTAKAHPQGEMAKTSGIAIGIQQEGMLQYAPPGSPDPSDDGNTYPLAGFQYEWMTRYSFGVAPGLQADLSLVAPMPIGLGLELGLKWELPIPGGERFAFATNTRGGISTAGHQGLWAFLAYAEAGTIISIHPGDSNAFYAAPRLRTDFLYHRIPGGESATSGTARGLSYGSALGIELKGEESQSRFFEVSMLHSPRGDHADGWRITFGYGSRDGAPEGGIMPW